MPKGSAELTQARKDEIIDACAGLYEHMNFRDITIKEIGRATSFTRTSIYNYYQTKEEIFLALLQREYALWEQDLCAVAAGEALSRAQLAQALAASLAKRSHMLKLLAMNLYDLEENSRMERLVDFKRVYGASIRAVEACLARLAPRWTGRSRKRSCIRFFLLSMEFILMQWQRKNRAGPWRRRRCR